MAPKRAERPTTADIEELLFLVSTKPLLQEVDRVDAEKVSMIMRSEIDWQKCCVAMENDPSFSPSHVFQSGGYDFYLLYLRDEDLFLLISVGDKGELMGVNLVMQDETKVTEEMGSKVIQKWMNYLLHYLWFAI